MIRKSLAGGFEPVGPDQHVDIAERSPRRIRIRDVGDRRTLQHHEPDRSRLKSRGQGEEVPLQSQRAEHRFAVTSQELGTLVPRDHQGPVLEGRHRQTAQAMLDDRPEERGPVSLVRTDRRIRARCRPGRTRRCGRTADSSIVTRTVAAPDQVQQQRRSPRPRSHRPGRRTPPPDQRAASAVPGRSRSRHASAAVSESTSVVSIPGRVRSTSGPTFRHRTSDERRYEGSLTDGSRSGAVGYRTRSARRRSRGHDRPTTRGRTCCAG